MMPTATLDPPRPSACSIWWGRSSTSEGAYFWKRWPSALALQHPSWAGTDLGWGAVSSLPPGPLNPEERPRALRQRGQSESCQNRP